VADFGQLLIREHVAVERRQILIELLDV